MEQSDARRLARMLSETTRQIHVALTESALRGDWPAAEEVWVIVPFGIPDRTIDTIDEAVMIINAHRSANG